MRTPWTNFIIPLFCLLYFIFELCYTQYAAIGPDEFWFAHHIYQYQHSLPYRDFSPYKTVLGYYILLIPMLFSHALLTPLLYIKNTIAAMNAIGLFVACLWLRRYFSLSAIIMAFLLLVFSQLFLGYSTDIRVDLLAYWCCLFSALCLFDKRFIFAGILIALGFLISQKALWYIVASNTALLFSRHRLKDIIKFNTALIIVLSIYIAAWSIASSLHTVLNSVFHEAFLMYQLDAYSMYRRIYWTITITNNPLLFLLFPLTIIALSKERLFIFIYAWTILALLILYKQVFPYYMIVIFPAFLFLYTEFFDKLLQQRFSLSASSMIIILFFASSYLMKLPANNNHYQKSMLMVTNKLLNDKSDYLAGIDYFYDRNQPIAGMQLLDLPALNYLYHPTPSLRNMMFASLNRAPDLTIEKAIENIKQSHIKLYVNNYRIEQLPPAIKHYLSSEYEHFTGSIYLYAPTISSVYTHIKFTGIYQVESTQVVFMDGKKMNPHTFIHLIAGTHLSQNRFPYRLRYIPQDIVIQGYLPDLWQYM